jgi:hypothetical protein
LGLAVWCERGGFDPWVGIFRGSAGSVQGVFTMLRRIVLLLAIMMICLSTTAWADPLFYVVGSNAVTGVEPDGSKTPVVSGLVKGSAITMDNAGTLYITNWGTGGAGKGTVSKITGTTLTDLASGLWNPNGITLDTAGAGDFSNYYNNNHTIQYLSGGTTHVYGTIVGGNGPNALVFDGSGNLYAADWFNNAVYKFAPGGGTPTVFVSGISEPNGLALDSAGVMYVSSYNGGGIYKVPSSGGSASLWVSGFSSPTGLEFDANGNLYVACQGDGTIRKVTPSGVKSQFASGFTMPTDIVMNTVPEPASLMLLGVGAAALVMRRRGGKG